MLFSMGGLPTWRGLWRRRPWGTPPPWGTWPPRSISRSTQTTALVRRSYYETLVEFLMFYHCSWEPEATGRGGQEWQVGEGPSHVALWDRSSFLRLCSRGLTSLLVQALFTVVQVESLYQEPAVHAQRIHRMIKLGLGIDEADEEARYPIDLINLIMELILLSLTLNVRM